MTAAPWVWSCEAYGPEGIEVGALCFRAVSHRVCGTAGECAGFMAGERQRVFRRINELAAAGDPDMAYLADQFLSPGEILGGDAR